jgi:DNA-repair protein complementing XP-A cells
MSEAQLTSSQARVAALNRLKAKERLTSTPGPSRDATKYINKPVAGPSTSRNAMAEQKTDEAPLRRDPGLV